MADILGNPHSTENRLLGMRTASIANRKFSSREVGAALALSAVLYLLNGEYAPTACTLLTAVPAAVFTYKVAQSTIPQTDYKSLLFFWTLFGLMSTLDVLLDQTYGYFLGKFVILAAAFGNAVTRNKDVFERMVYVDAIKTEITQCVTSIVSMYDSEGYPVQSPPTTAFSEDADVELVPKRSCNFSPLQTEEDDMMSTQRNTSLINEDEFKEFHGLNRALTPHPTLIEEEFPDCSESSGTICPTFGDLVTNPMAEVVFNSKNETKMVTVVNVSGENVMWALKSNALHKLGAHPACGVIPSGGTQTIKLVLHNKNGNNIVELGFDKVAIDYALVGGEKKYSPNFIYRNDKKRHLLRISYTQ